jgi:hypothetical protein
VNNQNTITKPIEYERGCLIRSRRALAMGICFVLACFELGSARAAPSLWDHNDSTVYLMADGATREFHYKEPRPGMLEAGVRIPTMPISRSSGSRSVIPIDPDQCGVA